MSSSLTPNGTNSIAIQVLKEHMLGVFLSSGDEPQGTWSLHSVLLGDTGQLESLNLRAQHGSWYIVGTQILIGLIDA